MPSAIVWVFALGPSPAAAFTTIFEANKTKKGKVQMKEKVMVTVSTHHNFWL